MCLAFHMSVCLCVARCPVFHVICHTWCSCASPDLWSRAAERPPIATARLVSLCTQRAPRQNAGMTRESFLAELQDRQTKERTAASGLQWWLLLHRLLLRSVDRRGSGMVCEALCNQASFPTELLKSPPHFSGGQF